MGSDLLNRVRTELRTKHYNLRTEKTYVVKNNPLVNGLKKVLLITIEKEHFIKNKLNENCKYLLQQRNKNKILLRTQLNKQ